MPLSPPRLISTSLLPLLAALTVLWSGAAQAQTYMSGIADNFVAPTEPVSPSPNLLSWIAANYAFPGSRPHDDASIDRWFGTTFTNLRRNGNICGATLRMTVRNGGSNDTMGLWFMGPNNQQLATGYGDSLVNRGIPFGNTGTITLNLAALPNNTNLIPTLNAQGFIDVVVQDDSAVDFVSLTITPCRTDVYIKDNATDFGTEPSIGSIWSSPDIRVCTTPGCVGHQNPEFGQTNYVYVTLRNNGPNAPVGNPAVGTLLVYYTASGGAAQWQNDWFSIGAINVTVPGGNTPLEVMVPWNNVPAPGHYCLLARWVSLSDPMTFAELPNSNTVNNTQRNNNIAWKNVNVVNLTPSVPVRDFDFRLRNVLRDQTSLAALEVRIPSRASFIERGQLLLTLDARLWATWTREGEGFEIVGEGVVRITHPAGARLVGLKLDPDAAHNVTARFSARALDFQERFELELVQHSGTPEAPDKLIEVGGVGYQINVGPDTVK